MTPIVFSDQRHRVCGLMRWGLIPSWSKGPDAKFNMINARVESITEKSAQSKPEQPYFIYAEDRSLFALAGIWEQWQAEAGTINSFSIITTGANEVMQKIHHRMPVIIRPELFDPWLLDARPGRYRDLLISVDEFPLKYHVVTTRVNSVNNDSPELTKPI